MNWIQIFNISAKGNTLAKEFIFDHYDDDQLGILTTLDEDLPKHGNGEPIDSVMYTLYTQLVDLIANQQYVFLADKYRELIAYTAQAIADSESDILQSKELSATELTDFNWSRL